MKRVLIFSYYSYKDPVFQSAVLPYIATDELKCEFILLTWEQKQFKLSKKEINRINNEFASRNIRWYRTRWHSGRFKLLKKAFDFLWGYFFSLFLIIRFKANYIYSEGFPGAVIGHYLAITTRTKHVVHTFEPHAAYMCEAGVWKESSWEYKLLKKFEIRVGKGAYRLITATTAYKEKLISAYGIHSSKILVLKSCVDTGKFKFKAEARNKIRKDLKVDKDQLILCYLGKLGGMYMDEELFEFISNCFASLPNRFYFMLFNSVPHGEIVSKLLKYKLPTDRVLHKYLHKDEVTDYLSAADFGIVAVRPYPSKLFCSPIKNGEYLASGLPLIIPNHVSDETEEINKNKLLGICLDMKGFRFDTSVGIKLRSFYKENERTKVADACASYAKVTRDINLGIQLLKNVFC